MLELSTFTKLSSFSTGDVVLTRAFGGLFRPPWGGTHVKLAEVCKDPKLTSYSVICKITDNRQIVAWGGSQAKEAARRVDGRLINYQLQIVADRWSLRGLAGHQLRVADYTYVYLQTKNNLSSLILPKWSKWPLCVIRRRGYKLASVQEQVVYLWGSSSYTIPADHRRLGIIKLSSVLRMYAWERMVALIP